jgi:hypothetical protein
MSSPDRIPPGETKPERERRVFRFFAADAANLGLHISLESVESKAPPAPDILCHVERVGKVAFELAEILDEDRREDMAKMEAARNALLGHLSTLSAAAARRFRSKFSQREIKVGFREDVPLRDLEAAIPRLYEWLIDTVADDCCGDAIELPEDLRSSLTRVAILFPGPPFIDIAFKMTIQDATISAVARKLETKRYETSAPIELIVYAHDQPLLQYEARRATIVATIVPMIDQSIARGHVRRVWIYDISRRHTPLAIRFVYPT